MQSQFGVPALQYVGIGPRFLAGLIDFIILFVIGYVIQGLIFHASSLGGIITGIIALVYYIVMEATQGATVGKMLLKLRVVKTDGSPISWKEAIIRTLLRIIDGLFVYIVAAIFMATSPLKQRLGDRVANTVVVRRQV